MFVSLTTSPVGVEFLSHHGEAVHTFEADLLDLDSVKSAMKGIDMVYHLAANPDIRLGTQVTDTDLKQDAVATYNVLEAMRLEGTKRIAFASSSVVYGEANVVPHLKISAPSSNFSLWCIKLASEALITSWVGTLDFKHGFSDLQISLALEAHMESSLISFTNCIVIRRSLKFSATDFKKNHTWKLLIVRMQ